jgi:hypothetical protein
MQASIADLEYADKKGRTGPKRFLAEIEAVTPSAALIAAIGPYYTKGEGPGAAIHRHGAHASQVHRPAVLWTLGRRQFGLPGGG